MNDTHFDTIVIGGGPAGASVSYQLALNNPEWKEILHDIASVEEVTAEISGKKIIFRSELKGCAGKVFQAAGVAIPPAVRFNY